MPHKKRVLVILIFILLGRLWLGQAGKASSPNIILHSQSQTTQTLTTNTHILSLKDMIINLPTQMEIEKQYGTTVIITKKHEKQLIYKSKFNDQYIVFVICMGLPMGPYANKVILSHFFQPVPHGAIKTLDHMIMESLLLEKEDNIKSIFGPCEDDKVNLFHQTLKQYEYYPNPEGIDILRFFIKDNKILAISYSIEE
jgi:hypothetical protein